MSDTVTDDIDRRGLFKIGGLTIAAAMVFAACGSDGAPAAQDDADKDGSDFAASDLTTLRTATSLELLAIDIYQGFLDRGVLTSEPANDTATLFQRHHQAHHELFVGATKERGGEVFADPNPVLEQRLAPLAAAVADEASAYRLLYELENTLAATYVATAGTFEDATLNQPVMSVAGVAARHASALAGVAAVPQVPAAFFATTAAVTATV